MYAEPTAQSGVAPKVAPAAGGLAILIGGGHVLARMGGVMPQVPVSTIIMKTNAGLGLLVAGVALILVDHVNINRPHIDVQEAGVPSGRSASSHGDRRKTSLR